MDPDSDGLDPREIKVLADILALVLQDQPAQSAVALDTLRRKARQNRVTAGALKNMFQAIAPRPAEAALRIRAESQLPDSPEGMRDSLERLRAANATLERALASANAVAARLQSDVDETQARLAEAHHHNRSLAERWRAGRRQASWMAGAIALCVVLLLGLTMDRLVRPISVRVAAAPAAAPLAATHTRAPARAPAAAPPPRLAAAPRPAEPATPAERDPELEQALLRLSRGAAAETSAHPAATTPAPAPAAHGAAPAAAALPSAEPASAVGRLPTDVYSSIVAHVRGCWRGYVSRLADPRFRARLQVITDESGVVREARLAPEERPLLSQPPFQAFVRAAMRSVLDPDCARLPIPPADLGHRIAFDFEFVP